MVVGAANLANSHVPRRRVLVVVAIVVAVAMVVVVRSGRSGRCGVVAVEVAVVAQEQPLGACPARVHGQKRPSYCRNHTPTIQLSIIFLVLLSVRFGFLNQIFSFNFDGFCPDHLRYAFWRRFSFRSLDECICTGHGVHFLNKLFQQSLTFLECC